MIARLIVSWIVFVTIGFGPANAVSVSPINIEMTAAGSGSRAQFTVNNDGTQPLPVEIGIEEMELDEDGGRKMKKAGTDFLVFPPQALIPANGTQTFRVQWVGDPEIAKSRSFMLAATQIPVKLPNSGKSVVQIVMSFGVVVNIAPNKGVPSLKLVSSGMTSTKDGKRHPTITVENSSNVHALLPQATIRLTSGAWSMAVDRAFLDQKIGIGLVQPGKRRKFVLPVDLPPNVTKVEATLDYKPKRN